jgi:hypothetical protein
MLESGIAERSCSATTAPSAGVRTNKPLALLQAVQSVGWRGLTYPWMVSESAMRMMEAETVTGLEGEPTQESFLLSTGENNTAELA